MDRTDLITSSLPQQQFKTGVAGADKEKAAARKAAREFETLFVGMMLKSMRETVGKDMLAGKGQSEDIYRSMLDQEYAKAVAEQGGLGLAKMIEDQLIKQQDRKPHPRNKAESGTSPLPAGE